MTSCMQDPFHHFDDPTARTAGPCMIEWSSQIFSATRLCRQGKKARNISGSFRVRVVCDSSSRNGMAVHGIQKIPKDVFAHARMIKPRCAEHQGESDRINRTIPVMRQSCVNRAYSFFASCVCQESPLRDAQPSCVGSVRRLC